MDPTRKHEIELPDREHICPKDLYNLLGGDRPSVGYVRVYARLSHSFVTARAKTGRLRDPPVQRPARAEAAC